MVCNCIVAILNGVFREKILVPAIGESMALPLSGLMLAVLVFLVTLMLISFIGSSDAKIYIGVGFIWVVFTLSFEFLFGHFVVDKPWQEIMQIFNIKRGDMFIVVLLVTAISPWGAAKSKGIL